MKPFWITLLLILLSPLVHAQAEDLNLKQYPDARVIYQTTAATHDYTLALSSYKKIAGNWQLDRSERLQGQLQRFTLELPSGHSAQNGFDFYLDQLRAYALHELYRCRARDCGTSNSWANNHFGIIQLYGLDQYQQYAAYEVRTASKAPYYLALYVVQRGNRRVYLQLDIVRAAQSLELGIASSKESVIQALSGRGYYVYPDLIGSDEQGRARVNIQPVHLQVLVDALNQQADWQVALVGHDYAGVAIDQQQANASTYAEQLKAALIAKGIAAGRIKTYGLGSLAPAGRGDRSARVEVVKISD